MKNQCPVCLQSTGLELIHRNEEFSIKSETVKVEIELYHCRNCNNEFSSKELEDPFKLAYQKYRELKGMVKPQEIISFRKKYNLTQSELSKLLGFGGITLSRYENGALQDEVHDRILKLVMEPKNLLQLVEENKNVFSKQKLTTLLIQLKNDMSLIDQLDFFFNQSKPDEYNGFSSTRIDKVTEVIKYLCNNREVFKTKLMKLLFYTDFLHYKNFHHSITGLRYAHLPHGPVPDKYELVLGSVMQIDESIELEPEENDQFFGEIIKVSDLANLSIFEPYEIETLKFVNEKFEKISATQISKLSHYEKAYKETQNSKLISYKFADKLIVDFLIT